MARRFHVPLLSAGKVPLDHAQARHALDALRLRTGDAVELFDDAGQVASGVIDASGGGVLVDVSVVQPRAPVGGITVACAVPKGERADWMVGKLAELGVARFVPLRTARSVVHPEGEGKLDRWRRLAVEAAKQSGQPRPMRIDALTSLSDCLAACAAGRGAFADASGAARAIDPALAGVVEAVLIGPEGGWTEQERGHMAQAGLIPLRLTATILRVETAAVVAAGALLCLREKPTP